VTMAEANIVACPVCSTANRVPAEKLGAGGKCGRCKASLFQGKPLVLTAGNLDAHAKSDIPLLVDFWAAWCGPCRQMAPAFAAAAGELEPHFRLGKLDTEAETTVAARYSIRSIPTLILLSKGREVARQAGAMPTDAIVRWARQVRSS
jgi:thioredoxin 2